MKYINLHTHSAIFETNVLSIFNQYPSDFVENENHFSVGIHPWYIDFERVESDLNFITSKLSQSKCLAIGECGLDSRIETCLSQQTIVFEKQLLLAQEFKKPVIVHCVGAYNELISIKKKMKISVPMVVHGFSKNENVAKMLIDNGFYLSFGKHLMLNHDFANVLKTVPLNKLFIETDSSDYLIADVYEKAAEVLKIDIIALQKNLFETFDTVFAKKTLSKDSPALGAEQGAVRS